MPQRPYDPPFTAACFTGGVDSFFTLLRSARPIDRLLFVHGFDIPLADTTRFAAFEPTLRRVAAARGKPAVVVRTNLREHPVFRAVNWERTHGGALAAVGHALAGARELVIPATYTLDDPRPWGSHHATDHLWSCSTRAVTQDGATHNRRQKLRAIAAEPIVWDALRVCWENHAPAGNCSRCEKCVRTMLILHLAGQLSRFTTFDRGVPLARRVRDLGWIRPHLRYVYDALLRDGLTGAERRAVLAVLPKRGPLARARALLRAAAAAISPV